MVRSSFRLAILAAALPLLAGCLAENRSTIIADPIDLKPFEGFWINARGEAAQILAVKAEDESARSANVTYLFMQHGPQPIEPSRLRAQATEINGVLYVELTGTPGANSRDPERFFGRISFGSLEMPSDRDKLTVCFAEADAMKGPVQRGELKGDLIRGRKDGLIPESDKVRITASTAALRAYLAANPLKCSPSSWFVFMRAKTHNPTSPAGP